MPTKPTRKRRHRGDYNLQTLQLQDFREWFLLCCGCWSEENRVIISLEIMAKWYSANRKVFDNLKAITDGLAPGHRPGERHPGWWFLTGFPEYGPRLITFPEQAEQRISRIFDGHWVPSDSFHKNSDKLIDDWRARIMPTENELREHNAFTIPARDFPDGLETSRDYLERHRLLTDEEYEILNEKLLQEN